MEIEVLPNQKLLAHNYGHGGSGWALAPGAASYIVNLLKTHGAKKDEPIAVIGAGALGLFSALQLLNSGFASITIYAERFEDLPSHNAGGMLAPACMANDVAAQTLVTTIGINSYRFYKEIAQGKNAQLRSGAVIFPAYFVHRQESGLEPFVGSVMKKASDVILDFGNKKRAMVAYDDAIFINAGSLMASLRQTLNDQVVWVERKIADIDSLRERVIVNCAGLGARELVHDPAMVSVQGHLIMLKDQNPADLQYMISLFLNDDITSQGFCIKRWFYLFPKLRPGSSRQDIGVLGGTFVYGAEPHDRSDEEFSILIEQAQEFFGLK